jgi:hypothetical protein
LPSRSLAPTGAGREIAQPDAASFSVNPHSCLFRGTLQQTNEGVGGTGAFAAASGSFTATVTGSGIFPRDPDGSCSSDQDALHEQDVFAASGTLSF